MALIASIIFLCLSALVALANIGGSISAIRRSRRNISGGYSSVPLFSIVFSTIAWALSRDTIGWWAFIPAIIDPATWMLVYLPVFLIMDAVRREDAQ